MGSFAFSYLHCAKTEASLLNPRDPYNQQFDSKNFISK